MHLLMYSLQEEIEELERENRLHSQQVYNSASSMSVVLFLSTIKLSFSLISSEFSNINASSSTFI